MVCFKNIHVDILHKGDIDDDNDDNNNNNHVLHYGNDKLICIYLPLCLLPE